MPATFLCLIIDSFIPPVAKRLAPEAVRRLLQRLRRGHQMTQSITTIYRVKFRQMSALRPFHHCPIIRLLGDR